MFHDAEQSFGSLHSLETRMARITMTGCSVSDGAAVADALKVKCLNAIAYVGQGRFIVKQ